MSRLKTKTVKLGDSATESNNYQIKVPAIPDGTMTIETADGTAVADFVGKDILWTGRQRQIPLTTTGLILDLLQNNHFNTTVSAGGTLTFSNIGACPGQSGFIRFNMSADVTITAGTNTKISATGLNRLGTSGVYLGSYYCDGVDVWVTIGNYT